MENNDVQEIRRTMRRREDLIQSITGTQLLVSFKVTKNEHLCINQQQANIMNLLVQKRKRIDTFEAKCDMLHKLALNLRKESLSMASNNRDTKNSAHAKFKEEESPPTEIPNGHRETKFIINFV
jgi:hypothetical protein